MSQIVAIENAELAYDAHRHEGTLARYAGRRKFTGCPECGSTFGMFGATQEQIIEFLPGAIKRFAPWYKDPANDLVLYYPCWQCNFGSQYSVPDGFEPISVTNVLYWSCSAMIDRLNSTLEPDYTALAAEEPVLASDMDRNSAGLEG